MLTNKFSKILAVIPCFMMAIAAVSFAACSSDDDDGGGSGSVKGYFEADNNRMDFKYAYVYYDEDAVELSFSTIDLWNIFKNPSSVKKGTYSDHCYIDLDNVTSIPTGPVSSSVGIEDDSEIQFCVEASFHTDLYAVINGLDDELCTTCSYCSNWEASAFSTLQISKSGNYYKIVCDDLQLLDDDDHDGGWDMYSRKTTGKFYFDGSLVNITDFDETRAVVVEKNSPLHKLLKKLRRNH